MARMLTLIIILLAGNAYAGPELELPTSNPVVALQSPCGIGPVIMQDVAKKNGEEVLFVGNGVTFQAGSGKVIRGGMMFTVNQDTGTWTMFQLYGDGVACMLFNGGDFSPYTGE